MELKSKNELIEKLDTKKLSSLQKDLEVCKKQLDEKIKECEKLLYEAEELKNSKSQPPREGSPQRKNMTEQYLEEIRLRVSTGEYEHIRKELDKKFNAEEKYQKIIADIQRELNHEIDRLKADKHELSQQIENMHFMMSQIMENQTKR